MTIVPRQALVAAARAAWDRAVDSRAAGDKATARRWLERAQRLAPRDALVRLTLGALLLEMGAPDQAAPLLETVAKEWNVPAAWMALVSCALAMEAEEQGVAALEAALRSSVLTPELQVLAERAVARWSRTGWCGVDREGLVRFGPGEAVVANHGPRVEVTVAGRAFIGSPLPMQAMLRVSGFVDALEGGIAGWAWYPADPDAVPRLVIRGGRGELAITATEAADGIEGLPPLARPRRFAVSAEAIERLGAPVVVADARGTALPGSPVGGSVSAGVLPPPPPSPRGTGSSARGLVDIVVPVYRGLAETLACLEAVLASVPAETVVHVVDDASPEPELVAALDRLAGERRVRLHRHRENRGFPAAANTGMRAAPGRDVVLLNSDTLVPPGWLDRLRRAAYAADAIGSATPLSNEGSIVTYKAGAVPDRAGTVALDLLAQAANAGQVADLPVGVGFCLYLRRDCLDEVGLFREDVFGPGYGEENDFCLRAAQAGWWHVAALDVFVAHVGGRSFGAEGAALRRRNAARLNRLHPGHDAIVAAHVAADPLFAARRRIDALRWAQGRRDGAVLLVTHGAGGGVAEMVTARAASVAASGQRPVILAPVKGGCAVEGYPDLRYTLPAELPAIAALLQPDRVVRMEVHHLLGHRRSVLDLAALLAVPVETWVHDAASFCPRISLVGRSGRYCGEPEVAECEACVSKLGSLLRERIGVRALRARSAAELAASRRIVVATADNAARLRRHFPGVNPEIETWEDAVEPDPAPTRAGVVRIVVVGAIAAEKGYDVLLDCARDARQRGLPLEFVVCGFTIDDERLMAAGPAFVTGQFAPDEAVALIRAQEADLAFVPSVCPESWCFGLSRAWQAGLPAVSFDLGAQAERIRATGQNAQGRGAVLPSALPIPRVNDALLRLAWERRSRQCLQL